jgi:hypothetical protein
MQLVWRKVQNHSMVLEFARPAIFQQTRKQVCITEVHWLNRGFKVTSTRKCSEEIKTTGNALRSYDELTDDVTRNAPGLPSSKAEYKNLKLYRNEWKLYSPLAKGSFTWNPKFLFPVSLTHTHTHTHTGLKYRHCCSKQQKIQTEWNTIAKTKLWCTAPPAFRHKDGIWR